MYYSHKHYLCVHHKSQSHRFGFGDVAGHNLWAIYCFLKEHWHCNFVGAHCTPGRFCWRVNWGFWVVWLVSDFPNLIVMPFNLQPPNDICICRTAPLTSRYCILYIYSTNICTEYFKHAAHSPFFPLQNAVYFIMLPFFGSCIIHILNTGCAKI